MIFTKRKPKIIELVARPNVVIGDVIDEEACPTGDESLPAFPPLSTGFESRRNPSCFVELKIYVFVGFFFLSSGIAKIRTVVG